MGQLFEPNYPEDNSLVETSYWASCVDIKEKPERFILYADIPGVDPSDNDKGVSVRKRKKEGVYTRIERSTGSFYRRKKINC